MKKNLESKISISKEKSKATKKLFEVLKRKKPNDLDGIVQEFHHQVFEEIDCVTCANCCKTTSPIFRESDIERLSNHLKMKVSNFISSYLQKDEAGDYVLKTAPCTFLGDDNHCTVYNHRPAACRDYPHTDRKRFYQVLDLTARNATICPAVSDIIEKLKLHYA